MLTISRRPGEAVYIKTPDGVVIEILVSRINGLQVGLSVGAPRSFKIIRDEVFNKPGFEWDKEKSNCA